MSITFQETMLGTNIRQTQDILVCVRLCTRATARENHKV